MAHEPTMGDRVARVEITMGTLEQKLQHLEHRMDVRFDDVKARFDQMAENFDSLREQMNRRFDEAEKARLEDRRLFRDVLGNHEGRIRSLENARGEAV